VKTLAHERTENCIEDSAMTQDSAAVRFGPRVLTRRGFHATVVAALVALALAPGASLAREMPCRSMTMLLIDITGSFNKWRSTAVDEGRRLIATLRAGDCLVVRTIGSRSFDDAALPPLRLPTSSRPIDPGLQRRIVQLKAQHVTRLEAVRHMPAAGFTDIWGAVLAAGETLGAVPVADKALVIYSDLEDNIGLRTKGGTPLRLDGARVTAAFIPRQGDPVAFRRRIGKWAAAFNEAGAASVALYDTSLLPVEVSR
jgi:hypothetical protein